MTDLILCYHRFTHVQLYIWNKQNKLIKVCKNETLDRRNKMIQIHLIISKETLIYSSSWSGFYFILCIIIQFQVPFNYCSVHLSIKRNIFTQRNLIILCLPRFWSGFFVFLCFCFNYKWYNTIFFPFIILYAKMTEIKRM